MRYFLEFAYKGTRFCGYQEQPNGQTVQSSVEQALYTLLRHKTKIVGCGRTDSGVHALQYFAHFDTSQILTQHFIYKLNSIIGKDIVFYRIIKVHDDAHARFDAKSRSYKYIINTKRNPFEQETSYYCRFSDKLNKSKMQEAAKLLLEFEDFTTFCKSKTDTKTNLCSMHRSEWFFDEDKSQMIYHVSANRFLRGMIRLIVGMSLNVGKGKTSIEQVKKALEEQKTLTNALSAPAEGLFLLDIKYDYI